MERAVYFDGWFPQHYCYHPSLPPRRLSMLDDLTDMRATMLVWAGLGGGPISLPYLEGEAFGEIPERFRQYGFVNESEFIAHARQRDIDLFAIVFEAQAWEFPAEIEGGVVRAQNELRGVAEPTMIGLREFARDEGPASWRSFRHYFPDGLVDSRGEPVDDLWEEVASRDLDGRALHAHWVEVDGHGECHFADRNNPVWLEYLKAIVRLQIDAGARAIQLDETDSPMTAFRYGGCFCKDCMAEFRTYAATLAELPAELAGEDLETFDYAAWLRARGHRAGDNPQSFPLYDVYARSQQHAIVRTFRELVRATREYAAQKGVDVRIAGNFYDCAPYYDPMVDDVDVLVTELRETGYQQPWYFRHGVGLGRGRPVVAVENPYGGMIPTLHRELKAGRARDRFRLSTFEATAMGANMALPYGSWLGTDIRDSYWVDPELLGECGRFLEEIDASVTGVGAHRTAVVYPVRSMMRETLDSDQFSDQGRWFAPLERSPLPPASYWPLIEALSRGGRTFDVLILPDEELRPEALPADALRSYDTVVLPDVWDVNAAQHEVFVSAAQAGVRMVVLGAYGSALGEAAREELASTGSVVPAADPAHAVELVAPDVEAELGPQAAVNLQRRADGGISLHVLNYDYDEQADAVRTRRDVDVVLPAASGRTAVLHRPGREPVELEVRAGDAGVSLVIPEFDTYAVVALS